MTFLKQLHSDLDLAVIWSAIVYFKNIIFEIWINRTENKTDGVNLISSSVNLCDQKRNYHVTRKKM
jgi:hypothetical protein